MNLLNKIILSLLSIFIIVFNLSCGLKETESLPTTIIDSKSHPKDYCYFGQEVAPCGISRDVISYNDYIKKIKPKPIEKNSVTEQSLKSKEIIVYQLPQSSSSVQTFSVVPLNQEKNNIKVTIIDNKTYQEKYLSSKNDITGNNDTSISNTNTAQQLNTLSTFTDIPKVNTYVGENNVQFKEITTPIKEPVYAIIENTSTTSQPVIVNFEEKKADQIYYSTYSNNDNSLSLLKPSAPLVSNNTTQTASVYSYTTEPISKSRDFSNNSVPPLQPESSVLHVTAPDDRFLECKQSDTVSFRTERDDSNYKNIRNSFTDAMLKAGDSLGKSLSGCKIQRTLDNSGWKMLFNGTKGTGIRAIVLEDGSNTAHNIYGAIYNKFSLDDGSGKRGTELYGYPDSEEGDGYPINGVKSTYQKFKIHNGEDKFTIQYISGKGVFALKEGIRTVWLNNYNDLGFPLTDEVLIGKHNILNYSVTKQKFDNGVVYWINNKAITDKIGSEYILKLYSNMNTNNNNYQFDVKDLDSFATRHFDPQFYNINKITLNEWLVPNIEIETTRSMDIQADPINMIFIVNDKDQLINVFKEAGWTQSTGVLDSLINLNRDKFTISDLKLFGRTQDIGFNKNSIDESRDHIRMWKWKSISEGEVWVAAATKDISNSSDRLYPLNTFYPLANPITHLISPDVDAERNYVEYTILSKNQCTINYIKSKIMSYSSSLPIEEVNGGMDLFIWDGRIEVINLVK